MDFGKREGYLGYGIQISIEEELLSDKVCSGV